MQSFSHIAHLPAYKIADDVNRQLQEHQALVVTAPPGAGKSTVLPLTIQQAWQGKGKVVVLEPRRIAARQVAIRMAEILGEDVGQTVGYRIRFENRVSKQTRIEVVTEGILTRMLISDPTLSEYDVVILDEYHERNIHSDIALALTREAQQVLREDMKIVVMSASIDAEHIATKLHAPVIRSDGRMFPVSIQHMGEEDVVRCIARALEEQDGDILVFLPGQAEIERTYERLSNAPCHVYRLYGMLSIEEQQAAIRPCSPGERKIVLATNIAETSLTIEGVQTVVDSGLCRTMVYDQRTGLGHLETTRISQDMALQRSGRAGRLCEGVCYRLWTKATETQMREQRLPEIMEADLAPMVLMLANWQGRAKTEDICSLPWMDAPSSKRVGQAIEMLQNLGALDENGRLTETGKRYSSLPCHPRIASMLCYAPTDDERAIACEVAAEIERGGARVAAEYRKLMHVSHPAHDISDYDRGHYLAIAFPEQIEKVSNKAWRIMGYPVRAEELTHLQRSSRVVRWDSKQGCVVAEQQRRIGTQVVDSTPLHDIDKESLTRVIAEAARKEGLSMFDWNDSVQTLTQRIATVASWHPELSLPDISTEHILDSAHEWLPLFGGNARTISDLKRIDLCQVVWAQLNYEQQQAVDQIAPTHIQVPTGSHIRIEYRLGAELPILRVRLQECFGMKDTPRVDNGQRAVLMELLSPGFKPVQLTQNLQSFWSGTYYEVRKELKRRYPKHYWPDNPLEAEPTRGVRRKDT